MLRVLIGLLLSWTCSLGYADSASPEALRVCYSQLKGEVESIVSSRANAVFNQLYLRITSGIKSTGLKVDARPLPWKRCAHLIAMGEIDAAVPVVWSPERETWAVYPKLANGQLDSSRRLRRANYDIFVPADSLLQWNGNSFGQATPALWAPVGYKVYEKLRKLKALTLERYGMDDALKMVALKRLDGAVVEANDGEHYISELNLSGKVKRLSVPFSTDDWYLVFSYEFYERYPNSALAIWQASAESGSSQ